MNTFDKKRLFCHLYITTLIFLLQTLAPSLAQVTISGTLVSSDATSVNGVNIIFHPPNNFQQIIAFGFSDNKGYFSVEINSKEDSIALTAKSLSFRDTTLVLANKSQNLTLHLVSETFNIKEVTVKGYPIISGKDTTTYIVNAFAQEKDFSIGDVISKMPGFEVSPSGKISYMGRDIQKYYIEGQDLLGRRYPLANKNLPYESVSAVEVLHNHQPIKAIDGVIATDATSINIRLKKNVTITGTAQTTVGFSPLLWDINLTPMLFQKNQQIIASWQTNNIGNNLQFQHQPLTYSNGELNGMITLKPQLISIPNISFPNIPQNRYLDNNAHLVTYNHLIKLNSDTELKINGSYYRDNIDDVQSITTKYFLEDSALTISEKQFNNLFRNSLISNLTLTRNVSSVYLENQLSYGLFRDKNAANIFNSEMQQINAELYHQTLSNDFQILIPIKKNFLQINSVIDFNHSPQQLIFEPGVHSLVVEDSDGTVQQILNKNLITENEARYGLSFGDFILSSSLALNHEIQSHETKIKSNGYLIDSDSLKNMLKWHQTTLEFRESIEYKKKKLILKIGFPLRYIILDIDDHIHSATNKTYNLLGNPFISANYKPSGYISANFSANYSKTLSDPNKLTQGYITISHRLIQKNDMEIDLVSSASYQTKVNFRNPLAGLWGTLSWQESVNSKKFLTNQISNDDGTFLYQAVRYDNRSHFRNLSSEFTWFIHDLKTTLGMKSRFNQTISDYFLNGQPSKMQQKKYELVPKILYSGNRSWTVEYSCHFSKTSLQLYQSTSDITETGHNLNFFFYPNKQHSIGFETEYFIFGRENMKTVESLFSNIVYRFNPNGRRINIKLQCRNIFNTHKIVKTRESNLAYLQTEYSLRPREFLITASWSLRNPKH